MFGFFGRTFRFANAVGPRQTHGVGYDFVRRLKADPTRFLEFYPDDFLAKMYLDRALEYEQQPPDEA